MRKGFVKGITLLLALVLVVSLFGCGSSDKTGGEATAKPDATTPAQSDNKETTPPKQEDTEPVNLTYWVGLNGNVAATSASYNEVPVYQEWQARTGVNVEFLHPPTGQAGEQFNLMVASMELPDIIEWDWINYPGGPEKAVEDEVILVLDDIIEDYAPNLKAYLAANPDIDKMINTDTGFKYSFPFIRGDDFLMVYGGPQMRGDWLEELGLEAPTTIDEWDSILRELKEKKGLEFALTLTPGNLTAATYGSLFFSTYGVLYNFYVDADTGKIKYGPMEPGFKQGLELLEKWYREGLLDPDFAAQDGTTFTAKVTGGKAAAWFALAGSGIGNYQDTVRPDNPNYKITGVPWPTINKGDIPIAGQKDNAYSGSASAAITPQSENIEAAARFLDYCYGEEGHMLINFGIEGVSYEMIDGYPTFTEEITNNPDGLSMAHSMARYVRSNYGGPFIQDRRYMEQYLKYPEQVDAINTWSQHQGKLILPPITATPDESQRLATIMNEVNTYVSEMFTKFIMGQEPLDNFDAFVEQMKKMNIERAIELKQAALDRYNSR